MICSYIIFSVAAHKLLFCLKNLKLGNLKFYISFDKAFVKKTVIVKTCSALFLIYKGVMKKRTKEEPAKKHEKEQKLRRKNLFSARTILKLDCTIQLIISIIQ